MYIFFQLPLFQDSVSHDPSEIILKCWFGALETIFISSMLKTVVLLSCVCVYVYVYIYSIYIYIYIYIYEKVATLIWKINIL